MLKKARRLIGSVNDALKGQLDLEQRGGAPLKASVSPNASSR
ncbi:hypothetical protein AB0G35_31085 [Streptomyces sp. NPDC021749]